LVHGLLGIDGGQYGTDIDGCQYRSLSISSRVMPKSLDPDVQLLAALADPTRMEILRELAAAPEVCACDFTSCCDVSQPTVSHHLKVLRDAGAVTSERRGNWVFYSIAPNLGERLATITGGLVPGTGIPASTLAARAARARAGTATDPIQLGSRPS
jgi:ArsR family transcriptional regulator